MFQLPIHEFMAKICDGTRRVLAICDDDELNINPPTPCLGKRPQRPKPKGPGRPWGQKPLAHGRTVEMMMMNQT